ncbi:sporulation protein [Neobacillus sp. PS3-34]|uniref:sporulation membrane protein YtrI n=1 Tax=Neobacillus sp. PS3-34 TaxID=3070678 RepID=UPI0027DFA852|nr:sporulation membrane protein YtrI [Neobacillus sp. PS3-34]WML47309.1 sporulation protein [Neobacillus sp. PS3-34]
MRIPPLYRRPAWQRLLAGMVLGGCISWAIFLYIFGVVQEESTKKMEKQEEDIKELTQDIKIWQDEYKALNKKNIELLKIQDISVKITNWEKYKQKYGIDSFSVFEVEDAIKEDIAMVKAKDLDTVFKSRDLLKKVIENRIVKINDKRFRLEVKEIVIYTTLSIQIHMHLEVRG